MPSLLIRHHVRDYLTWKAAFDEHEPSRRANGSQGGWLFVDAADPCEVVILLWWDNLERARLFAESDDWQESLERAGVAAQPDIWLLEDVGRPPV